MAAIAVLFTVAAVLTWVNERKRPRRRDRHQPDTTPKENPHMTTDTVPAETATNSDNIEGWEEIEPTNTTGETETCGAQFATADRTLACDRDDRHITHRDAETGDRFTRAPGGAVITPAKR